MLTVFTPTYNRAYTLPRLYDSLIKQTNKDFEWIVVDDGSTDDTEGLVKSWTEEKKINIRYFRQDNQGKMIAHNKGIDEAKGELFVCVDSDDYLTENAVEVISKKWMEVKEIKGCVGIVGGRYKKNGQPIDTYMPKNVEFSNLQDLQVKYKYKSDTILIYKTKIIKKYKFPKIEGEKFIPEGYIYNQIDQEGKLAIISEGIYICEYLPDGYTTNVAKIIMNNPKGYILAAKVKLKTANGIKEKLKACAKIVLGNWLANQRGYIKESSHKVLMILSIPFACYIYLKKYRKLGED